MIQDIGTWESQEEEAAIKEGGHDQGKFGNPLVSCHFLADKRLRYHYVFSNHNIPGDHGPLIILEHGLPHRVAVKMGGGKDLCVTS